MKIIQILLFILLPLLVNAQTNAVRINPDIKLPKDSVVSKNLIAALNGFLQAAQKPNAENKFILESEKPETFILLDEVTGIEKNEKLKDPYFYKPYLTNVVALQDGRYLIQVSYLGTEKNIAFLRASFEFIAHPKNFSFVFSSPLLQNTQNWKVEKAGANNFYYQHTLNKAKIKQFNKLATAFDLKLNATNTITDFYCTENIVALQKLIGVNYKSDYNGRTESVWSASLGKKKVVVLGNNNASFNHFDPHDLFHDRLSLVMNRNELNKPVDEGCAYLYGGSWGLSWPEIFKAFKEKVASNKNINWLEVKETPVYFKTNEYNNSADYIVNALLVKKIEKEKGFGGVLELLKVGPFEKGNTKYYQTLEKLTGISKANYNDKVWELINNEK